MACRRTVSGRRRTHAAAARRFRQRLIRCAAGRANGWPDDGIEPRFAHGRWRNRLRGNETVSRGSLCLLEKCRQWPGSPTPGLALLLVERFGDWAPWLLDRSVLDAAPPFHHVPAPSPDTLQQVGACGVLFVCRPPLPALRSEFVLPLQWVPQERARSGFEPLHRRGQTVAAALGIEGYVLEPLGHVTQEAVELVCCEESSSWRSGWLALALGLLSAATGRPLTAGTLATGAWDDARGLVPVDHIPEKARLVTELGARRLLIPDRNATEVAAGAVEVVPLPCREIRFDHVIRPIAAELLVEPPADAPDNELQDHYRALRACAGSDPADAWYERRLLPLIALRLRRQWEEQGHPSPEVLVSLVSQSPPASLLAMAASAAKRIVVLHTDDAEIRQHAARLEKLIGAHPDLLAPGFELTMVPVSDNDALLQKIGQIRDGELKHVPSGQVCVDLTPGTKEMTISMFANAARPGDLGVYVRTRHQKRQPVPLTEELRVWRR
ncbi:MAG: hypothetical protein D6725_16535 [Planctomycetota bacterium]|nr:MAG: hypothetical protein D6725_16535 [Planctomycetota bacterium]